MEYISTIAMCILAFVTYLYLKETKNIRQIYENNFYYELSPKAFLEDVKSIYNLNEKKRSLEFFTTLWFKNTGKTEAFNFEHELELIAFLLKDFSVLKTNHYTTLMIESTDG